MQGLNKRAWGGKWRTFVVAGRRGAAAGGCALQGWEGVEGGGGGW